MKNLTLLLALAATMVLGGCSQKPDSAADEAATAPAETATTRSPEAVIAETIAAMSARPAEDAARDPGRKPAEVLAFLGLEPGMTVLDVFAAGGWYSEVMAGVVGPAGRVIIQNPPRLLEVRDGMYEKQLTERLATGRLSNVERIDKNIDETGIDPGSVDFAITALNFHDMYYLVSPEAAAGHLAMIHALLKPGGVLGITDHYGAPGADNASLHRIEPQIVKDLATAAGFVVEGENGTLHNHNDDMTQNVFAPDMHGKTHRFVLRLRKPQSS